MKSRNTPAGVSGEDGNLPADEASHKTGSEITKKAEPQSERIRHAKIYIGGAKYERYENRVGRCHLESRGGLGKWPKRKPCRSAKTSGTARR